MEQQKQFYRINKERDQRDKVEGNKHEKYNRDFVTNILVEKFTPLRREINMDVKQFRAYIEECMTTLQEHKAQLSSTKAQID